MRLEPHDGVEMAVEIDGIQHFQEVEMFGGAAALTRQRRIDIKKSLYCYDMGIPLLRIAYTDLDRLEELMDEFISYYRYNVPRGCLMYSNDNLYADLISGINKASPQRKLLTFGKEQCSTTKKRMG